MQGLFREHFERAVRDFAISIIRVLLASVGLSLIWDDDLHVSFRTQSSTLQQSYLILHASAIDIPSCFYVIQSIGDDAESLEELIREDILCSLANLVQSSLDVSLKAWVHLCHCGCCGCALRLAEMLLPEQELSVEVGGLNVIGIGDDNVSVGFSSTDFEHCEVFKQLAANCSGSNHEDL